jgi:uncharacterized RDD family membrane protein YckC
MSAAHPQIDRYVTLVLRRIPRAAAERARIASDIRTHIQDRVEAGQTPEEAIRLMGPPEELALGYLAQIELPLAPLGRRFGAFLIDLLIGMMVVGPALGLWFGFVLAPLWGVKGAGDLLIWWIFPIVAILVGLSALALSVLYFPVLEAVYGQTVGKRVLGLCVTTEQREHIGWGAAILRRLPLFFELFWLDALFALFTRQRQRAFDLVAKTVVVRCR